MFFVTSAQLKNVPKAQLSDMESLVGEVRNGLPGDSNVDLFTLPELLARGRSLETHIDWSNLRNLREVQSQIQHMPLTSPIFQKLQQTLAKVESWRRDFQRVVSLMKSSGGDGTDNDKSSGHRRNVVVSGQSGFLKDLFSSGAGVSPEPGSSEKPDTRSYTQSQTVEEARTLLENGLELSIQCEEITQLQGWVSECDQWSSSVKEALGIAETNLHATSQPSPAQSWNIDGLNELQRY